MGFMESPKVGLGQYAGLGFRSQRGDTETEPQQEEMSHVIAGEKSQISSAEDREAVGTEQRIFILYDEYRPRLLRYLGSMQLTRDQAEETIQETFLRLTTELAQGKKIDNIQGWIVRVSHNLAIDLLKRAERDATNNMDLDAVEVQEPLIDTHENPYETYQREERLGRIEAVLRTLNSQQRHCFHLRVQGFRYKDMAIALGISEQRAAIVVKQVAVKLATVCQ